VSSLLINDGLLERARCCRAVSHSEPIIQAWTELLAAPGSGTPRDVAVARPRAEEVRDRRQRPRQYKNINGITHSHASGWSAVFHSRRTTP